MMSEMPKTANAAASIANARCRALLPGHAALIAHTAAKANHNAASQRFQSLIQFN